MSIKFFKGLGQVAKESVSNPISIGQSDPGVIERDENLFRSGHAVFADDDQTTLKSFVQVPGSEDNGFTVVPFVMNLQISPQVFSAESGQAPFETLFHDFDLKVFPFYNFWTPDELTNDKDERGERRFEDLPRYVKISWIPAPDLPDPEEQTPKRVNKRTIKPIIFARELERPKTFKLKGVDFTPKHLQPDHFIDIKAVIANGFLAPGVLETIVELPLRSAGIGPTANPNPIDEDPFLNDPATAGVAAHELIGQALQLSNGAVNTSNIGQAELSPNAADLKNGLFDGKFSVIKGGPDGMVDVLGVHPSSPAISFSSRGAEHTRAAPSDPAADLLARVAEASPYSQYPKTAQAKVKFFDPSIGNLVGESKVRLMTAPEHLETMAAIAPSLANLELLSKAGYHEKVRKYDIPSLPSPRMKPLEYIGYVLEKYRRGQNGLFLKVDEIDLPNREINEYIDTKVLYGETYRYRIRAVLRWTRPSDVGVMGKMASIKGKFGSQAAQLSTHQGSYFYGEWSQRWIYGTVMDDQPPAPPDELTARPESHRKRVVLTFRLPLDNQRDILSMRLFRKLQDENGRDLTDWIPMLGSSGKVDHPPQNVIFFDDKVEFFHVSKMRYVYAAQCTTRHGESSVLSEQLAVRLNQDHYSRGEYLVEQISAAGVRLQYYGAFSTIPFQVSKTELVVAPPPDDGVAALVLTGRDASGNMLGQGGDYLLRVQSLDTGEQVDIPFSLVFKTFQIREKFVPTPVFVMPASPQTKGSNEFKSKTPTLLQKVLTAYQDPALVSIKKTDAVAPALMAAPGERWKR